MNGANHQGPDEQNQTQSDSSGQMEVAENEHTECACDEQSDHHPRSGALVWVSSLPRPVAVPALARVIAAGGLR